MALLTLPTSFLGAPFDMLARIPLILNAIIVDLLFSSNYRFFKSRNKLLWLTIIVSVEYNALNPFFSMLFYFLFYPPPVLAAFIDIVLILLPVIIIESIVGGYIGYKVYERVKVLHSTVNPS